MEPADTRRPFRALLDVGLVRTTTGNRVFGALKVQSTNFHFFIILSLVQSFAQQNLFDFVRQYNNK